MKSSENLFQLIKSLSQSEKRYFKRFASQHIKGEKNIYVKLFDLINKQDQYDENKIIKKFPGKNLQWLSRGKHYLFHLVLKCLRNYNSDSHRSVNTQLKDLLIDVENLFERTMFKNCSKLLVKTKEIAYKYGKDSHLLEILKWEKKLFYSGEKINLDEVLKEELQILNKRKNIYEYDKLLSEIFILTKGEGLIRKEKVIKKLNKIIRHPLLNNEERACSFDAKLRYYNIYSLYYQATGNLPDSCEICKKWVTLLESHKERINEAPFKYITALDNLLLSRDILKNSYESGIILLQLKYIPFQFPNALTERVKATVFTRYYFHSLTYFNSLGEFKISIGQIPEIEEGLKQFKGKLDKKHELSMVLQIVNACFVVNDYHQASKWLNKILNDTEVNIREDIHCFARILNIIINYEKDHEDMDLSLIRSTYSFLAQRNRIYDFEPIILDFFNSKIFKAKTHKELIEAFKGLKKDLVKILKDPFERKALKYFDFISWLKSKIEDKPMAEVIKNKRNYIT
ncbi:MAG: hypothetical protein ABII90_06005 [Bacteroidota bacterium]